MGGPALQRVTSYELLPFPPLLLDEELLSPPGSID
jgi:hypothetical protein